MSDTISGTIPEMDYAYDMLKLINEKFKHTEKAETATLSLRFNTLKYD